MHTATPVGVSCESKHHMHSSLHTSCEAEGGCSDALATWPHTSSLARRFMARRGKKQWRQVYLACMVDDLAVRHGPWA